MHDKNAVVILGATASGKTSLAVKIAKLFNGEIISADSRQVYKELTLGSGKDLAEYGNIPYHIIDLCTLDNEYTVFNFQEDCLKAFDAITKRKRLSIIAGGTALYLNSILSNYNLLYVPENSLLREKLKQYSQSNLAKMLLELNPNLHNKTDLEIRERTIRAIEIALYKKENPQSKNEESPAKKIKAITFKIVFPRSLLRERIRKRLEERIDAGMIEEVKSVLEKYGTERVLRLGLEYRFTTLLLKSQLSYDEYFEKLYRAICQFAKRQETWFRKMQREGIKMIELDGMDTAKMLESINDTIRQASL